MNEKSGVILRYARSGDFKNIIELLGQLDRPLPNSEFESIKFERLVNEYTQSNSIKGDRGIILATTGSNVIGLVSFVILDRLNQSKQELWIPDLVVSKQYRNQGIGKLLIQKCESIARRKKCYRVRLESRNDRIGSHKFYKGINFKQIALVFEKRL